MPEDAEEPNEEIPLSEGAEPYAEEEPLPPASEENLKVDLEDKSPLMTRQRKQALEGKPRRTYTQYEADSLDLFEDPSIGERGPIVIDEEQILEKKTKLKPQQLLRKQK